MQRKHHIYQQLKKEPMNLESLPNEIFHDVFEYLNGSDLLHAFYGLNYRINCLLYQEYRAFRFDFRSISKRRFDMICAQDLRRIFDRVSVLSFAQVNNIPKQMGIFFSHIPSLEHFTHLKALSFSEIDKHETTLQIIDQCMYLHYLTHFKIYFGHFSDYEQYLQLIIEKIWSLSKLVHCEMDFSSSRLFHFKTSKRRHSLLNV